MATQTATPEAVPAPAAKQPPMMIITIVAVVLSIIGSLVVAKVLFGKPSAPPKPVKAEVGATMVLDEFLINLADTDMDRYVKTTIALGLKKGLTEDDLKDKVPEIRDVIVMVLSCQKLEDIRTDSGKEALKKELVDKINDKISDDKLKNPVVEIYFQGFATQ